MLFWVTAFQLVLLILNSFSGKQDVFIWDPDILEMGRLLLEWLKLPVRPVPLRSSTSSSQLQQALHSKVYHDNIDGTQCKQSETQEYEIKMLWHMSWFLVITLISGYLASLATGIIGFSLTRDAHFILFISPTFLAPFIYYLVPMDEKRFQLALRKIEVKAQKKATKQANKLRTSP